MFNALIHHSARLYTDPKAAQVGAANRSANTSVQRHERAVEPHPAIHLITDGNNTALQINGTLQSLLGLDSNIVHLGRDTAFSEVTAAARPQATVSRFNVNIPKGDLPYLSWSHEDLVRLYIKLIDGFEFPKQPTGATPFDTFKNRILFALDHTPGREADTVFMRGAFKKLQDFFPEFNYAVQEAATRRPELRETIERSRNEAVQRLVIEVLAGQDIQETADIDTIIANAQARVDEIRNRPLMEQTRLFYSKPGCVEGAGAKASRHQVRDLADGKVVFPDLKTLLRYAPVGKLDIQVSKNTENPEPPAKGGAWFNLGFSVTYDSQLIKKLYYIENPGTRQQKRIAVMMGHDAFRPSNSFPFDLPQDVPAAVRLENQRRLEGLIREAQRRRG